MTEFTHDRPSAPWYKTAFDDFYLSLYSHRNQQDAQNAMAFLRREKIVRQSESGLDLCCGPGRHLLELQRVTPNVVGLDLSWPLLQEALRKLHEQNLPVQLVQGSMERLPFGQRFDWIVNLFTSFGYFERDADNARVFQEVARVLKPGGRFLIDFFNASYVSATLVPESTESRPDGLTACIRRSIEGAPPRVVKRVRVANAEEHREITESVRLFTHEELKLMLQDAGLRVVQSWGNFAGDSWNEMSPRSIVLAEK